MRLSPLATNVVTGIVLVTTSCNNPTHAFFQHGCHARHPVLNSPLVSNAANAAKTFNNIPLPSSTTKLLAWPLRDDPKGMPPEFPNMLTRVGVTAAACVWTWYAATQRSGGSAVLASSAVTLIFSLIAPGLGQASMCGTFAGMTSTASGLVPTLKVATTLGLITSVLFEFMIHTRNLFLGLGGRLGLTAFIGVNGMALVRGVSIASNAGAAVPWVGMSIFGALGSMATIALREASDDSAAADPVRAAAVIGLLAALLVGFAGFSNTSALGVYQGAFCGMSLPSRLMRGRVPGQTAAAAASYQPSATRLLLSFGLAGLLGGLVHALTLSRGWWMGGWGGKAGFCAFVGVLLYRGLSRTITVFKSLVGF